MTLLADDKLCCGQCGRPCADLRGLRAHERSHVTVSCPECGDRIGQLGIGAHRRAMHGIAGQFHQNRARTTHTRPTVKSRRAQLERLLPAAAPSMIDRLARWTVTVAPSPDLWVVIGPTDGPHLTNRVKVGLVVAGFREPALVFPLSWLDEFKEVA